jgi:mannose/cellobiose epimerase-like protein (N-acyl-D-glucosamine 2-epimerase family)
LHFKKRLMRNREFFYLALSQGGTSNESDVYLIICMRVIYVFAIYACRARGQKKAAALLSEGKHQTTPSMYHQLVISLFSYAVLL